MTSLPLLPLLPLLPFRPVTVPPVPGEDDGFGALSTALGNLPLRAVTIDATVTGLVAHTVLAQTFVNPNATPLEATFIFPLPPRGAVTSFEMVIDDRRIEGILEERGAARARYDAAIDAGLRAAIAEEERPDVFTMRVGNLLPADVATVRLTIVSTLAVTDGEATFRFPLVVAPRYMPGHALPGTPVGDGTAWDTDAVPDASRISPPVWLPGCPNPIRLAIGLRIEGDTTAVRTSLPARCEADGRIVVEPGQRADRDFIVRFPFTQGSDPDPGGRPETRLDTDGETFVLTVLAPTAIDPKHPAPATPRREVVLILDRSGSMSGWKMVAARRALARMVDTLGDRDRCCVLAFDNDVESPPGLEGLVAATDRHRHASIEFLAKVDARGGTDLDRPLRIALDLLSPAEPDTAAATLDLLSPAGSGSDDIATTGGNLDPDRVVVLVTDGQVGNEDQLLSQLGARLRRVRMFIVGIDTAVNEGFLQRLAELGGGACELVESEDRLDAAMDRIHRRLATPVGRDLRLTGSGIDLATLTPARVPDLFSGAPLVVSGRLLRGAELGPITLCGTSADGGSLTLVVAPTRSTNPALGPVWARGRLRDLEDRYTIGAGIDAEVIEREIVATSLAHGVLCRFTAFVAVDVRVVNEGGRQRRITQPVALPAGWDVYHGEASMSMPLACGPMSAGGSPARKMSRMAAPAARSVGAPPANPESGMQRVHSVGPDASLDDDELATLAGEVRVLAEGVDTMTLAAEVARLVAALRLRRQDEVADELERLLQSDDRIGLVAAIDALLAARGRRPFWKEQSGRS